MIVNAGHHLKDHQLLACYLAARTGDGVDPRAAEHLSDCPECVSRYDDVGAFMDRTRADADTEIDELFSAEHLRTQQQQILRRLEHANRSARVITFPGREAAASSSAARLTPRRLAAAAAAGLFIGLGVGGYFGPERLHRARPNQAAPRVQAMTVQPRQAGSAVLLGSTQTEAADDDAFLVELELALTRPHPRELQPFDAMTPHVRDIDIRER